MLIAEASYPFSCTLFHSYSVDILTANRILPENSLPSTSPSVKRDYFCTDTEKKPDSLLGIGFSNNSHFSMTQFLSFTEDFQKKKVWTRQHRTGAYTRKSTFSQVKKGWWPAPITETDHYVDGDDNDSALILQPSTLHYTESAAFTKRIAFGKWVVILHHPYCKSDSVHIILFMSNSVQQFHNYLFGNNPSSFL